MVKHLLGLGIAALLSATGCGNGGNTGAGGAGSTSNGAGASGPGSTNTSSGNTTTSGSGSSSSGGSGAVTAQELLAKVTSCTQLMGLTGNFATDMNGPQTVPICQLNGAVWWQADMDIDCDGQPTKNVCDLSTDMWFQPDTFVHDSNGKPLVAASLPYVVVPQANHGFSYQGVGLKPGNVIAVIYDGKLEYAVFGDLGPKEIIGEASYATAAALGIDPDPTNGGIDCTNNGTQCPVTYIAFTGDTATVKPVEDHNAAVTFGDARRVAPRPWP